MMMKKHTREVGRILRLGGPTKSFRGEAFSPDFFLNFQKEMLEFRGILSPETTFEGKIGTLRTYLYTTCTVSRRGRAKYWGGHGPPGPPSNYLPALRIKIKKFIVKWKSFSVFALFSNILEHCRYKQRETKTYHFRLCYQDEFLT